MATERLLDDPALVERARAMRTGGATYAQIRRELGVGTSTVSRLLGTQGAGRKSRITDVVRQRATALRVDGLSIPEIARELGIARSSAWLLTRDIRPTAGEDSAARRAAAGRAYWREENLRRALIRQRATNDAASRVGELADRELLLLGAVAYWAEGTKAKPWRRRERLSFTNSDPNMIRLFLAWLDLIGVDENRLSFRVHIHESADIEGALTYWAGIAGVPEGAFSKTTVKRHKPVTNRHNVGDAYRGCLVIQVRRSADEYRLVEGLCVGIVCSLERHGPRTPA
jgi:transposase-like protein